MDRKSRNPALGDRDARRAYWETRLRADYNLGGVGYTELGEAFNRWIYRVRRHGMRKIIRKLALPRDASVLDVGSGTGFMIDVWRGAGFENVQGCDLTTVAVEGLTRRFPSHRFLNVDISSAQIPYSSEFDAVSSNDVLFHIVDDAGYQRAFTNIFGALRPGGYFVFSDNFLHGPDTAVRAPSQPQLGGDHRHVASGWLQHRRSTSALRAHEQPRRFIQPVASSVVAKAQRGR